MLKKATSLENLADKGAEAVCKNPKQAISVESSVSIEYTRTLDKVYARWARTIHKISPLAQCCCTSAVDLPSMRKDRIYNINIFVGSHL